MENIIIKSKKTCIYEGCNKTRPIYNYEGETKGLYCLKHKLDDMINVISKTCIYEGCKIRPNYNYKGETKGLYCLKHKLDDMIDINHKTCIYEGCKIRPNYNYEGETKGLYCVTHKLDDMINVIDKTCIYDGCKTQPIYNYEGEKKRLYCAKHKLDGMISIKHLHCKTHLCYTIIDNKYDGYCAFCYINLYPDSPKSFNYKTKEKYVVEFIKNKYDNLSWISDKKILDGCSRRRPDLLLDLGYQVLIIEIDEYQHINYESNCENKRLMEISLDLNHRPIIFVRFNPDSYKQNNIVINSCWTINKNGLCIIKKSNKDEWEKRLDKLCSTIDYWINPINISKKTIEIIQLYYDS